MVIRVDILFDNLGRDHHRQTSDFIFDFIHSLFAFLFNGLLGFFLQVNRLTGCLGKDDRAVARRVAVWVISAASCLAFAMDSV